MIICTDSLLGTSLRVKIEAEECLQSTVNCSGLLNELMNSKIQLHQALQLNSFLLEKVYLYEENPDTSFMQTIIVPYPHSEEIPEKLKQQLKDASTSTPKRRLPRKPGSHNSFERNDTKNIPKNYGKAILRFIERSVSQNLQFILPILKAHKIPLHHFLSQLKHHKRYVNSINYLKSMWGYLEEQDPIKKCIRILSYNFMRKHCLGYIFNSRVKNYGTHIKYRQKIIEGIEKPERFNCIKEY